MFRPTVFGRPQLLAFVFTFLVVLCFYLAIDLQMQVIRAENSLILEAVFSPAAERQRFFNAYGLRNYSGHFIPVAFALEMAIARVIETSALWAMLIQLLFVSGLVVGLGSILYCFYPSWIAFPAVLCFVFTPIFTDIAAWPWMKMQLICMAMGAAAVVYAIGFARSGARRDAVVAMAFAYGSMHFLGVGLPMSVATIAVVSLTALRSARLADIALPVAVFLVLTAVHGWLMLNVPSAQPQGSLIHWTELATRFGALVMRSVIAGPLSIYAPQYSPYPRMPLLPDAIYGYGLLAAVVFVTWRSYRRGEMAAFAAQAFAVIGWLICLAAMIWRLKAEADDASLAAYVIGGRYFIFTTYFTLIWAAPFFASVSRLKVLAVFSLLCGLGTAAFMTLAAGTIWPMTTRPQEAKWNAYVDESRERIRLGLPLVNSTIDAAEFQLTAKNYQNLLKHQLRQEKLQWE